MNNRDIIHSDIYAMQHLSSFNECLLANRPAQDTHNGFEYRDKLSEQVTRKSSRTQFFTEAQSSTVESLCTGDNIILVSMPPEELPGERLPSKRLKKTPKSNRASYGYDQSHTENEWTILLPENNEESGTFRENQYEYDYQLQDLANDLDETKSERDSLLKEKERRLIRLNHMQREIKSLQEYILNNDPNISSITNNAFWT